MSLWQDFLDDVFGDENKPGKVMICFVNRQLEGMDGVQYKIKYDSMEKSGTTTEQAYCVELQPKSFAPIQTYVWSRKALAFKKLDDVVAEPGKKKLVRKALKTFKTSGHPDQLPKIPPNNPPPTKHAPAPAPGPSPKHNQGHNSQSTKNENNQPLSKPERPLPNGIMKEQLRKIFPKNKLGAPTDEHLQAVADELNKDLPKYKLDTPVRRAHFFGQVKQEAGSTFQGKEESLNYSAAGLMATFGYYKKHPKEAKEDGRIETKNKKGKKVITQQANQEVIANKVYGPPDTKKLGNTEPGDGWNFRGRGMKQLTGRDNYKKFKEYLHDTWSEDIDLISKPSLVSQMPYSIRSAVYFWVNKQCYVAADAGITDAAIDAVTKIINAGEINNHNAGAYDENKDPVLKRRENAKLAYAAFT
ncbi:MAG: hypothetical protein P4N59_33810 [Negativicutes bacterium]|nr:hypothetical protein [Negativicutes bacterium]